MPIVLRGLAIGAGAAFLVVCFRAYLDPSVAMSVFSVLSLCR